LYERTREIRTFAWFSSGSAAKKFKLIKYSSKLALPVQYISRIGHLTLVRNALTGINYRWSGHVFSTYERELSSVSSQQNLIKGAKDVFALISNNAKEKDSRII